MGNFLILAKALSEKLKEEKCKSVRLHAEI